MVQDDRHSSPASRARRDGPINRTCSYRPPCQFHGDGPYWPCPFQGDRPYWPCPFHCARPGSFHQEEALVGLAGVEVLDRLASRSCFARSGWALTRADLLVRLGSRSCSALSSLTLARGCLLDRLTSRSWSGVSVLATPCLADLSVSLSCLEFTALPCVSLLWASALLS